MAHGCFVADATLGNCPGDACPVGKRARHIHAAQAIIFVDGTEIIEERFGGLWVGDASDYDNWYRCDVCGEIHDRCNVRDVCTADASDSSNRKARGNLRDTCKEVNYGKTKEIHTA